MVGSTFNIALSGLMAAATKISVSAKNIANAQSTSQINEFGEMINEPYKPMKTVQKSHTTGGVIVDVVESDIDPVPLFDPSHPSANDEGIVNYPNVSLDREFVDIIRAGHEYKANLKLIQREKEIQDSLLDILE